MSKITDFIIDRKELVIIGTIIAVLIASVGLQTLEFSSGASDEALPSDLKSVENQEILQNNFGSDDTIMVSVAVDDYSEINSILDPEVVESTYKFTENVKDRDFVNQASSYASLIYKVLGRAPKSKEEVKNKLRSDNILLDDLEDIIQKTNPKVLEELILENIFKKKHVNAGMFIAATMGDLESLKIFDDVLEVDRQRPKVWYGKGLISLLLGDHDAAIRNFEKAISLEPDFKDALYEKGVALHEKGRTQEALNYWKKARKKDDDY